jgi:hypothetical protein
MYMIEKKGRGKRRFLPTLKAKGVKKRNYGCNIDGEREGGKKGRREVGREGGREGGTKGRREGGREGRSKEGKRFTKTLR